MSAVNPVAGADGDRYVPYEERAGDSSVVFFTRDLSEEGIKAAAVTAFGGKGAAGPLVNRMIITIAINHPFLYLVRDKATGDIWFVGTVYDPTLWSSVSSQYNG